MSLVALMFLYIAVFIAVFMLSPVLIGALLHIDGRSQNNESDHKDESNFRIRKSSEQMDQAA